MTMIKGLEKTIQQEVEIRAKLNIDLALAISQVLKNYGVNGEYIFNVRKDSEYCQSPVNKLKDVFLTNPLYCLGSGAVAVEKPNEVHPV